jgi:hypothetical protein
MHDAISKNNQSDSENVECSIKEAKRLMRKYKLYLLDFIIETAIRDSCFGRPFDKIVLHESRILHDLDYAHFSQETPDYVFNVLDKKLFEESGIKSRKEFIEKRIEFLDYLSEIEDNKKSIYCTDFFKETSIKYLAEKYFKELVEIEEDKKRWEEKYSGRDDSIIAFDYAVKSHFKESKK